MSKNIFPDIRIEHAAVGSVQKFLAVTKVRILRDGIFYLIPVKETLEGRESIHLLAQFMSRLLRNIVALQQHYQVYTHEELLRGVRSEMIQYKTRCVQGKHFWETDDNGQCDCGKYLFGEKQDDFSEITLQRGDLLMTETGESYAVLPGEKTLTLHHPQDAGKKITYVRIKPAKSIKLTK